MKKPVNIVIPEGMKWCHGEVNGVDLHGDNISDHIISLENFYRRSCNKTDGRQGMCKNCKAVIDKKYNDKKVPQNVIRNKKKRHERTLISVEMKKELKCVHCGFEANGKYHMCMSYHHVDPNTKSFSIANAIRDQVRMEEIEKEIKKTVVLCSNCHAIVTYFQTQWFFDKITKEECIASLKEYGMNKYLKI